MKLCEKMEEKGYVLSEIRNYYTTPFTTTGYKGLHLKFISPYGPEMELQIHSDESLDAKNRGHKLYEKVRSVSTPENTKEELQKELFHIHSEVKNPRGIEEIKEFVMKTTEKDAIKNRNSSNYIVKTQREFSQIKCSSFNYAVFTKDGELLFRSFDITQSDGSLMLQRQSVREGKERFICLDVTRDISYCSEHDFYPTVEHGTLHAPESLSYALINEYINGVYINDMADKSVFKPLDSPEKIIKGYDNGTLMEYIKSMENSGKLKNKTHALNKEKNLLEIKR